jgi:apolipoprotein D and lipocalin family protein
MQFLWPFKGDYRVIYLDEVYSTTVIGREKRDYVWLMARTPDITAMDYEQALNAIRRAGYDIDSLKRVPQNW